MEGTYEVTLGAEKMGIATVTRQGLYWHFSCRCNLSGEVMHYLWVQVGDKKERLGLLTPESGAFSLRTKLPMKRLGQGNPLFFLRPKHEQLIGQFVPVRAEEPFAYLHRLQEAHLAKQNRQLGIVLPLEK